MKNNESFQMLRFSNVQVRRVKMGIMHPNYTWNDKEFDIGLVKLNSPLKFTDYIQAGTDSIVS